MRSLRLFSILSVILALALPAAAQKVRDLSFVYLRDADRAVMSGDIADLKRLRKAVKPGERILWFRTRDGKELVVRDPATLDRFEAAWKSADALAQKQGEIGGKQGEIGGKQGQIGGKQGQLGGRQGQLAAMEAELSLEDDDGLTAAQRDARAKKLRAIEAEKRQIEQKLRELEAQMRKLEPPMRELERQMRIVSKQHEAAAKQAQADTEALIARAISGGLAKPL